MHKSVVGTCRPWRDPPGMSERPRWADIDGHASIDANDETQTFGTSEPAGLRRHPKTRFAYVEKVASRPEQSRRTAASSNEISRCRFSSHKAIRTHRKL